MTSPESIRTALFAWANATGCELLSWRFVGVCVEARFEVASNVELRVLAPTVGEVVEQLDRELAEYRKPRLRLVRGGRS